LKTFLKALTRRERGEFMLPTLADIEEARRRISGAAIRTPLVRLGYREAPAEIYLKLENLQPIGSFKIRGASNAMGLLAREVLAEGVLTASAGNMAQGVAWRARELGVPCTSSVSAGASSRFRSRSGGESSRRALTRAWARTSSTPSTTWT
jgi:threonine dehydratase